MTKQVGYIRVSSVDQNDVRQLEGVSLDKVFREKASGKSTQRPELTACLDYLRDGDVLHVHSIDRLARNSEDLLRIVRELNERQVSVRFHKENLEFSGDTSAMNQLMLQMLSAFAQFERSMIRERQKEGIAAAKKSGKRFGAPKKLSREQIQSIADAVQQGASKKQLAEDYGVSRQTIYSVLSN